MGEPAGTARGVEAGLGGFWGFADLRGRAVEGSCPDCGEPAAGPGDATRLDRADPWWVKRVRLGVGMSGVYVVPLVLRAIAVDAGVDSRVGRQTLWPATAASVG